MLNFFPRPVTVLVGLGFPHKIARLRDALLFLDNYPAELRDEAYAATVGTCRRVLSGEASVGEANEVFTAFARRRDFLVDDPLTLTKPDAKLELDGAKH